MKSRSTAIIAFLTTTLVILGAATLNAESPRDAQRKAMLDIVAKHFEPSVVDTHKPVNDVEIADDITARIVPVQQDGVWAVDVVVSRGEGGSGLASAKVRLNCSVETMAAMSRVPRPVQVEIGHKDLMVHLRPGQTETHRVTFKPNPKQRQMAGGTARITASLDNAVLAESVYVALNGNTAGPQQLNAMLNPNPF